MVGMVGMVEVIGGGRDWEGPTCSTAAGRAVAMRARNTTFRARQLSGRYWDRTSDLFRVKEARYHCANRPCVERL